jgi:hypothetical protein
MNVGLTRSLSIIWKKRQLNTLSCLSQGRPPVVNRSSYPSFLCHGPVPIVESAFFYEGSEKLFFDYADSSKKVTQIFPYFSMHP